MNGRAPIRNVKRGSSHTCLPALYLGRGVGVDRCVILGTGRQGQVALRCARRGGGYLRPV